MLTSKSKLLNSPMFFAGLLIIVVLVISIQHLLLPPKSFYPGGALHTHYNNYVIFKQSWFHLIANKDLYQSFPEHWDYYKYSPTFSVLMAPFAYLPDSIGLFCWNLLNVLILFFAFWKLPAQTHKMRLFGLAFISIELISSVHNSQSNALIAGLIIFAFLLLEKKQIALASLFIVLTIFIKVFGLVALALFIFYPNKIKAALYTIGWMIVLAALPLLFISFSQLTFLYHSWTNLLRDDHSMSYGLSVAGWLHSWFGVEAKNLIVGFGAIIFCLPLIKYKCFSELKFRLLFLASVLVWIVIFNHKAEPPTFIIAVSGVAIWYFFQKPKIENTILLILVFIFTVLSPVGIFPKVFLENYIQHYALKAVPCILVWFKIVSELLLYKPGKEFQPDLAKE
jgi:hypothetical protein